VGRGGALEALDWCGKQWRRLSTASRSYGGGPARWRARKKKWLWKCKPVEASASAWEAPGCARGLEEGMVVREQGLASRRESWRLGRQRRDVERRGEGQREVGSGGAGAGVARGARKGGAGAAGERHMAGEGGMGRAQRNRGGGDSR
jgi:hypothetical protein